MSFMVWNQELETGVEVIDQQHRELVAMLNRAAPVLARSQEDSTEAVGPLLDSLLSYAGTHFSTEETMMERAGMDVRARDHHHASHADFAAQVHSMTQLFTGGREVTGDQLLTFLASWLILHILGEDQAMARQFRALEAGMPAPDAYVEMRGDELHPSPAALSHALIGIYTIHTRENRELLLINDELDASRAAIQHQNENLERLVGQRTAELEQVAADLRAARDAAEAANRAKTRFLGTMSHELRTPMNAVLGFSRLLKDRGLSGEQGVLARKIVAASERLLVLLDGIIDYARLEGGGGGEVQKETFDLGEMLREASTAGFLAAKGKGLETRLELDPGVPAHVHGDAGIIQRVLSQFISNAVKFTARGSVRVSVARMAAEGKGRVRLRFSVSDTGIGMSPEIQARLFQPFMQAEDGADRKFEGIGLGLALSRELARLMDGEIGVSSEPGQGSTFWMELALRVDDSTASDPRPVGAGTPKPLPTQAPASAGVRDPIPENLRSTLQMLDKLLRAYDTRAAALLAKAAPSLRPCLGPRFDTLSELIDAFDYDQACLLLKSLTTDNS